MATEKQKRYKSPGKESDSRRSEKRRKWGTLDCISSGRSRPMYLFIERVI